MAPERVPPAAREGANFSVIACSTDPAAVAQATGGDLVRHVDRPPVGQPRTGMWHPKCSYTTPLHSPPINRVSNADPVVRPSGGPCLIRVITVHASFLAHTFAAVLPVLYLVLVRRFSVASGFHGLCTTPTRVKDPSARPCASRRVHIRPETSTTRKEGGPRPSARGGGWRAHVREGRSRSPYGGAFDDGGYTNVCLVTSLRSLGVPVLCDRSGPFRAIAHGNPMLEPFSLKLAFLRSAAIPRGRYVLWKDGHFVGVHVKGGADFVVFDGEHSYGATSRDEVTGTLPCIWYQLRPSDAELPHTGTVPALTAEQMQHIETNRTAALKRKWSGSAPGAGSAAGSRSHGDVREGTAEGLVRFPIQPPISWMRPILPPTPTAFFTFDVALPKMTFLSTLHAHPMDARVMFLPGPHTYIVDGLPMLSSVTSLIHSFAEAFDSDAVATKMVTGANWPRPGYLRERLESSTLHSLREHEAGARLADLLCAPERDEIAICDLAKKWSLFSPEARSILPNIALTREGIQLKWETNRVTAANMGTWMHFCFEAWLNGCDVPQGSPEMSMFFQVVRAMRGLTAYRTEWVIFGREEQLAGCIDFVATDASSDLVLFDWKRTSKLRTKYTSPWRGMLAPLGHLDDCAGVHYRLQLNMYKYLLEKYYGKRVSAMWVVCAHPDNDGRAFLDRVPVMSEEVVAIMRLQRRRVTERNAMMANDPICFDPPGGMDSQASQDFDTMITLESGFLDESLSAAFLDSAVAVAPPELATTGETPSLGVSHPPVPDRAVSPTEDDRRGGSESAVVVPVSAQGQGGGGMDAIARPTDTDDMDGVDADDEPNDLTRNVDSGSLCKRRRYQKGASTSNADFRELFEWCADAVAASTGPVQPEVIENSTGIVHRTQAITAFIGSAHSEWCDAQVRLVCAALSIYKMRLVDMFLREHVLLLWIIEGGRYMRAHDGTCYFYHDDGAFQMYRGVPPESTFSRVKSFLLELEGLFRLLPRDVKRTDEELLTAISASMENHANFQDYLHRCLDAAIFNMGDRRQQMVRGRSREYAGGGEDAEATEAPVHWNILVAGALNRVGLQIQKEMLEERIISFVIEWCETPDVRAPGCCYVDVCVLYDSLGENARFVSKSPTNNVYLRIPHPLLDPVLDDAKQALRKFYSESFWCNVQVFKCMQAAMALAKRGENIDRCFIGVSPGGVGQSLMSAHIAAMLGHLHAFIDPNIWYHDDEFRKQVEQFVGRIVLTAQEAPENSRKLREDLYKKTMSADGIAGRKPYGIRTRMLEVVGWKRLEANRLIQFAGVSERNFQSIYRRSFVWKPKARFLDPEYLKAHYPDHAVDGIFPKNPSLKKQITSGPAIAAGLQHQHGFELHHSKQDSIDMIEQYAALGGDDGLTEDSMRLACGLKLRDRSKDQSPGDGTLGCDSSQTETSEHKKALQVVAQHILDKMLAKQMDIFTGSMFKYFGLPSGAPNTDKETTWRHLQEYGLMTSVGGARTKAKDAVRPLVTSAVPFRDIIQATPACVVRSFPETYDLQSLSNYLFENPSRELNVAVMTSFYSGYIRQLQSGRGRGKRSAEASCQLEDIQRMEGRYSAKENIAKRLYETIRSLQVAGTAPSSPRRRMRRKASVSTDPSQETAVGPESRGRLTEQQVHYHYTMDRLIRTRRQADTVSAQGCSRRVLQVLCPHTVDLDIENCMFVLLDQLVQRLELHPPMPGSMRETLKRCAYDREVVCRDDLRTNLPGGKHVLTTVLNGSAVPPRWQENEFLLNVQRLARYLRWVACSLLPDVYETCKKDTTRRFPEASTLFYLWTAVEDSVLSAWLDYVHKYPTTHLSLHFDGIRIQKELPCDTAEFCKRCADYIAEETGFKVLIREKFHRTLLHILPLRSETEELGDVDDVFIRKGNCIYAAVMHLIGRTAEIRAVLSDTESAISVAANARGVRSYVSVRDSLQLGLAPHRGCEFPVAGLYLLHTEHDGNPHCVAVTYPEDDSPVTIIDGRRRWSVSKDVWSVSLLEAVDRCTMITFRVFETANEVVWPDATMQDALAGLLDLQAGGGTHRKVAGPGSQLLSPVR